MDLFVYQIISLLLHASLLKGTHMIAHNRDNRRRKQMGWMWWGGSFLAFLLLCYLHYPEILDHQAYLGATVGLMGWGLMSFFILIGGAIFILIKMSKSPSKAQKPSELKKENQERNKLLGNIIAIGSPIGLSAVLIWVPDIQTVPAIIATACGSSLGPMFFVVATSGIGKGSGSATYSSSGVSSGSSYSGSSSASSSYSSGSTSSSSGSFSGFSGGSFGGGGATGSW